MHPALDATALALVARAAKDLEAFRQAVDDQPVSKPAAVYPGRLVLAPQFRIKVIYAQVISRATAGALAAIVIKYLLASLAVIPPVLLPDLVRVGLTPPAMLFLIILRRRFSR
ncbi:MAG TPA: hypothetical protein VN088_09130 [Nocardioides sp.]|nr:hypothetical protein [Nocardioides sp.]